MAQTDKNFGEATIKCLLLMAQTQKQPYFNNQLRYSPAIWYVDALCIYPQHILQNLQAGGDICITFS